MDVLSAIRFHLLHAGYVKLGAEWQFDNVISPFSRLYLITEGKAWVRHHEQTFDLRPGYLYLIPSFSLSRYHCDTHLTQFYLSFLDETENGLSVFDEFPFAYEAKTADVDIHLLRRLLALNPDRSLQNIDPAVYDNQPDLLSFNQSNQQKDIVSTLETQAIILQLLTRFIKPFGAASSIQATKRLQLRSALNYIHTHLSEKITIDQLAALNRLNVDYFSRQFQRLLGIRPLDYINNKRLERAQLLLMTSSLSLQAIAEQTGFADIYYFSRLFKRRFGLPPGQYRKRGLTG